MSDTIVEKPQSQDFVHLHAHTYISMQDALPSPAQLAMKARSMGQPAIAITDHGRMGGCIELVEACRKPHDTFPAIKPILGLEAYTCEDRTVMQQVVRDDGSRGRPSHPHLTLWAGNRVGYRNLLRLSSDAAEHLYYDPRTDKSQIEKFSEGVFVGSGCLGSEVSRALRVGDMEKAERTMRWFKDVFGDRYYAELQFHGISEQKEIAPKLAELAKKLDIPLICANDVHYLDHLDWKIHDILIQMRDMSEDKKGGKNGKKDAYGSHQFYMKSEQQMRDLFDSRFPGAVDNTVKLAERIDDYLKLDVPHLLPAGNVPMTDARFVAFWHKNLPYNKPEEAYLAYLAFDGLCRMGKDKVPEYRTRLMTELRSIWYMGVTAYFLLQREMVEFMQGEKILFGIRGSGVGSLVLRCLEVCSVDPIRWHLMFERFLNPGRGTQFKIDFPCFPFKQWLGEVGKTDQAPSVKRIKAIFNEKGSDPLYQRFSAEMSRELWVLENQSAAHYVCDIADRGMTTSDNVCQLWSAYFLGITSQMPEGEMIVAKVATLPDVDTDIDDSRRGEVINWARQRFGEDKVAQIGTRGTYQAKAAVIGALKVSPRFQAQWGDRTHLMANVVSKSIPIRAQPPMTISDAKELSPEFAEFCERYPEEISNAEKLVGTISHYGIHAGGVLVASEPIRDHAPLDNSKGSLSSAYDMSAVERIGLVKYDYLGLATLRMLAIALRLIWERRGVHVDLSTINLDDKKVLSLYTQGKTASVFQFASKGMRNTLKDVEADSIDDLVAIAALFRPGPAAFIPMYAENKRNPSGVTYPHPIVEKHLKSTYGVLIYQEQAMFIAREMAGLDWDEVDKVRKAVSKKDDVLFEKIMKVFKEKAIARGIDQEVVDSVLDMVKSFSGYAFNRSHSTAYAILSFATAYLRVYYTPEWMAACFEVDQDDDDKKALYRQECQAERVLVSPPNVNESGIMCKVSAEGRILLPLTSIKGVGASAAEAISLHQPYANLHDMARRGRINRAVVEALGEGHALHCFEETTGKDSAEIMELWDREVETVAAEEKAAKRLAAMKYRVVSPMMAKRAAEIEARQESQAPQERDDDRGPRQPRRPVGRLNVKDAFTKNLL